MPEFTYEAIGTTGARSQGVLTAASEREALSLLDRRGLFPLNVQQAKAKRASFSFGAPRVKSQALATFYGQLADLLRSGVPLLKSLDILGKQSANLTLSDVVKDVRTRVADGTGLAEAMMQHPSVFNELSVSMVRAGQEGGFLEDVLQRIAEFTEHQQELKSKVTGALAYPIFLAVIGFLVLNVLVIFFVPKFEPILEKLEAKGELPTITKLLMGTSAFLQQAWPFLLGAITLLIYLYTRWIRTESGRYKMDSLKLKLPIAGTIFRNLALSRFTRILGTMLQNGIPILKALRISKDSAGNKVLAEAIEKSAENVKSGDTLAAPLAASSQFPPDIVEMVAVGEESNNLEEVLLHVSEGLERRTARQLDLFVRLLEPAMLLVMAVVTLTVVAGLLIPVFKMSSAVG